MKKFFIALMASVALVSCSKDDNKVETPKDPYEGLRNLNVQDGTEKEISYLDASNNEGKYVYFSFNKGVVEVSDPQESNDWDIAFNRYSVRTNSGTSGSGNGGALTTNETDWDKVATASSTASFTVDGSIYVFERGQNNQGGLGTTNASRVISGAHGENFWNMISKMPNVAKIDKSSIVHNNGWLTMDYKPNGNQLAPSYTYNNWVYVIKTPAGKYAKIQLNDYKNAKGETGYITFKYELANDKNEFK